MKKTNKYQTYINIVCSVLLLVVNLAINFFLSPFIVDNIGVEAHGFISLANNFVTYANLIVTALNSMAARFITIEYHRGNIKKADIYYNSVFWGNLFIVLVLLVPATILIVFLEKVLSIPAYLIFDVKLLFSIVFITFFLQTGLSNWSIGTYVKNRLDREYIPNLGSIMLKGLVLLLMFTFLLPGHVWYVGFATFIAALALLICQWFNKKKFIPEVKFHLQKNTIVCSKTALKELIGSGVWNSISSLGVILYSGLDLIVCNIFLGPIPMGIISIAKTLPNISDQLRTSISRVFLPELTIDYSENNFEKMTSKINNSMQLTSFVMVIATVGICLMSGEFYRLWMQDQDYIQLQILVILSLFGYYFSNGISVIYSLFTVTNKVKQNALVVLGSGFLSILLTATLIRFTNLGIYAICGTSTFISLIKNLIFVIPYGAKSIHRKWITFFPNVIRSTIASIVLTILGYSVYYFMPKRGWGMFILTCLIISVIGLITNWFIVLNKDSKRYVLNMIKKVIKKRNK